MLLRQLKFYFNACLFVIYFFVSLLLSLFSFTSPFKRTSIMWMEYCIALPVSVCGLFFFFNRVYCMIISAPVEYRLLITVLEEEDGQQQ